MPSYAPITTNTQNFLALAASGDYDNTLFHRNIRGFMVQGGDPTGTGKGGQSIWGAPFADEIKTTLRFGARGVVAMANAGPGSNRAQVSRPEGSTAAYLGRETYLV